MRKFNSSEGSQEVSARPSTNTED